MPESAEILAWLRSPDAIRQRCNAIYAAALAGESAHFSLHEDRLAAVVDYVLAEMRANYPDLVIPYHSRWRHFTAGGRDRWAELAASAQLDRLEQARVGIELAIVSVLLDAGAGSNWSYRDNHCAQPLTRSEGLAAASFDWYQSGGLSAQPDATLRVDASALQQLDTTAIADAFQVSPSNPLIGLDGRLDLLHRLGQALQAQPQYFGDTARLGHLFDYLQVLGAQGLRAEQLLAVILTALGSIWPGRLKLMGENLGDVWQHPAVQSDDASSGLVPFHKLSQWLSYSLVEPLQEAGITVTELDRLTGLPEYRNGGLFIDLGVLTLNNPDAYRQAHSVDSTLIVEWRALTVILLDQLAALIRHHLNKSQGELPLAKILQGGSWSAGRRIAQKLRPDGSPPLQILSDGTVF